MDSIQRMNVRSLSEMVAESSGLEKLRLTAQLAATLKNAGVAPPIVSIYNNQNGTEAGIGAPQDQGQGNTMLPAQKIRFDRYEAEARKLLAEGFVTKAAQQRAKEFASRAFEEVKDAIQKAFLNGPREGAHGSPAEKVYYAVPSYPHEWKPRHAAMIRDDLPAAAVYIADADRIAALAAEIKATPILPKIADEKAAKAQAIERVQSLNPTLLAEFEKQAPAIAREFEDYVRRVYAIMQGAFPDGVPSWVPDTGPLSKYRQNVMMLQAVCDLHSKPGPSGNAHGMDQIRTMTLKEDTLKAKATKYGEEVAVQWFYKTNGKLGALDDAKLINDNGGDVHVTGKRGGKRVEIVQQRIINTSPLGKAFHQFPSRIYVDGKFVTEAAYVELMK